MIPESDASLTEYEAATALYDAACRELGAIVLAGATDFGVKFPPAIADEIVTATRARERWYAAIDVLTGQAAS